MHFCVAGDAFKKINFPFCISVNCYKFASASLAMFFNSNNAKIAQLVERHLAKVEVAGSNPVFRSSEFREMYVFDPIRSG